LISRTKFSKDLTPSRANALLKLRNDFLWRLRSVKLSWLPQLNSHDFCKSHSASQVCSRLPISKNIQNALSMLKPVFLEVDQELLAPANF
jgi:hypothetical protein